MIAAVVVTRARLASAGELDQNRAGRGRGRAPNRAAVPGQVLGREVALGQSQGRAPVLDPGRALDPDPVLGLAPVLVLNQDRVLAAGPSQGRAHAAGPNRDRVPGAALNQDRDPGAVPNLDLVRKAGLNQARVPEADPNLALALDLRQGKFYFI